MNKYFFRMVFIFILVVAISLAAQKTPDAILDQTVFQAKTDNETLLHIHKPGRYSIQVKSEQGTRITIVDRMAGPYQWSGRAGRRDGRLDLLLDIGTYKIRLNSYSNGPGQVILKVFPFQYVKPVTRVEDLPYLPYLELIKDSLEDLQQQSSWIEIKERQVLRLEMLGRNLKDARLWRDGSWLEEANPTITTFERVPGQPMTHIEFHHDLNPGLYLLTCYGGPEHKWTKETGEHPFYLRMGIPQLGKNGQRLLEISPFGRDTFEISSDTNFFQLVREEKKPARIETAPWSETRSRYYTVQRSAAITKKSRDPWCIIKGSTGDKSQWVTITAPPGDRLELDYFEKRDYRYLEKDHDRYWISSIHSAEGRDAIDVTALMTDPWENIPVKADVITVTTKEPITRKVNLLGNTSLFLFIEEEGTYVVDENPKTGAKARYRLRPFMIDKPRGYRDPSSRDPGSDFELTAGYYVLDIYPTSKGILHFALHKKAGFLKQAVQAIFSKTPASLKEEPQRAGHSLLWPEVKLKTSHSHKRYYTIWLNRRYDVESGIIVRKVPLLLEEPLPVPLEPGQSVVMKVRFPKESKLTVGGGNFQVKVDNVVWDGTAPLAGGFHHIELQNRDSKLRLFNVQAKVSEPYVPPPKPVLKKLADVFPILTEKKPLFRDFERQERHQFLLQVESPALYRLETTGRMATAVTVRTRTSTSLFNASQNGIGRNALVQQYLKASDYLVNVSTVGQSKGRAGIHLRRTELDEIAGLTPGSIKRYSLKPDAAVRCRVEITEPARCRLETYSLGKPLTHRLEDADGWPLLVPGGRGAISRYFKKGTYFYYSLPQPVESRRVTFLKQLVPEPKVSGKGPHRLQLNKPLENIWLENTQRSPDVYHTEITAPIRASITVTGEMEVKIAAENGKEVGTTTKGKWSGRLPAGNYNLLVKSIEKNNRMPYTIRLTTSDLIPGLTQPVRNLPAEMDVSLDKDALVDITSFGDVDVKSSLWDEEGKKRIAAVDDIPNDWNFRISRNLKAGRYRLKISAADSGSGSGPVEVQMQEREELVLDGQAIPFSVMKKISRKVLRIPFNTGETETLLHIKIKSSGPLELALMRDGKLLAEAGDQLYIPLPGQRQYTLLVWSQDEAFGETRIDAAALKLKDVRVTTAGRRQTIPTGTAVRLVNETGLSFRLKSAYYSPLMERPCLLSTGSVEGTQGERGWLVGTGKQVQLEVFEMQTGHSTEVVLNDIPAAFRVHQKQEAPLLLEIKSVSALLGAAVFPEGGLPENVFARSGMLAAASRTLVGIPGKGEYWAHTWLTSPTPPVISEKNRFDTGERTSLTLTAYPKQNELDFQAAASIEAQVEPGQSVWLQLKEEPQLLDMTLARGLVAFSWSGGHAVDMAAALEENAQRKLTVKGDILYVVNTGDQPARFRAEKRGVPTAEQAVLDPGQGFEKILSTAGTLQLQLPEIQQGMKLFVAGSRVSSHLWGTNGKIYHGIELEQPKNFDMHAYDSKQISKGFLEIRYGPGLVKIWQAPTADDGQSFMGNKDMAETAVFTEGMGTLIREPNRPQLWEFSIDTPTFVSLETLTPTAIVLMSEEKVLYMSMIAFRTGHQLNHYLPVGTYRLMTRVLPGTDSPGNLTLKTITPTPLDEGKESPMQIIRPGELQVFRFTVAAEGNVGVGLRTENDTLEARLFDEKSQLMATGPLMLKKLPPGTYLLVVETRDVPVQYRPIILGTKGSREGVPDDVIQKYTKETDQ